VQDACWLHPELPLLLRELELVLSVGAQELRLLLMTPVLPAAMPGRALAALHTPLLRLGRGQVGLETAPVPLLLLLPGGLC
jgi:hypothetical protein